MELTFSVRSLFHGGHLPPPLVGIEEEPFALGSHSHPFHSHTALTDRPVGGQCGRCSGHRTSTDFKSQHQVSHYHRNKTVALKAIWHIQKLHQRKLISSCTIVHWEYIPYSCRVYLRRDVEKNRGLGGCIDSAMTIVRKKEGKRTAQLLLLVL